ncbi:hypothetical protein [Pusillimonas sp.]|nr:hypothetical protein [Pusillimonas sp.]MDX3896360.1 hypothetical protein [Pusillimonas sp.]
MFALIGAFACLGALKYDLDTARDMDRALPVIRKKREETFAEND